MRSIDQNYSGKHGLICLKFEMYVTVGGVPFFFRGPVAGSVHDARLYSQSEEPLFKHNPDEIFLGDLGYIGCAHFLCPFKKSSRQPLTTKKTIFNKNISNIRSRIERYFSFINIFRCFQFCDHNERWLKDAMTIVTNVMYCILANNVQYEVATDVNKDLLRTERLCTCRDVPPLDEYREGLLEFLDGLELQGKKPRKAKRGE
eukprot:PhM_4_TR10357/c6_g1_i1/m.80295